MIPREILDVSDHVYAPFELMARTSEELRAQLASYTTTHTAILIFGSPHRSEMLPKSDTDIVVVSDDTELGARERGSILNSVRSLSYDKVDTPIHVQKLEDLVVSHAVGSPETNIADCTLIEGSPLLRSEWERYDLARFFSSPEHLIPKQVFQHFFFDAWARIKQTGLGTNIKYSIGGARDLLILDQYHDLSSGGEGKRLAQKDNFPQILAYIVDRFSDRPALLRKAAQNIGLILSVKHATMNIDYGNNACCKGLLNQDTAQLMLQQHPELMLHVQSAQELVEEFTAARQYVRSLRESEYRRMIRKSLSSYDHSLLKLHDRIYNPQAPASALLYSAPDVIAADSLITDIVYLARTSEVSVEVPQQLVDRTHERGIWYAVGTLALHSKLSGTSLHELVTRFGQTTGFEFINRIAIRHPALTRSTAQYMLQSDTLAVDEEIDKRYRKELHEQLGRLTI